MAKKNRYYDDSFEEEPIPPEDDFDSEFNDLGLEEDDIIAECGKQNAIVGQAFYQRGLVSQRSFDGRAIHATIQDGASNIPVVFDMADGSAGCTHQKHLRFGADDDYCEHVAALMWAYVREPESFLPQNIGGFIDLLNKNPQAREQLAATDPGVKELLDQVENMPTELRAALSNLPINATPEQAAAAIAPITNPDEQLKTRLRQLSLEQLRAIAKRRGWGLVSTAKEPLVGELALLLANAPLPTEFSPEEEQLTRLENTFYGLSDTPSPSTLQSLWRARGGGDLGRLERAVRGLQTAGVLFPCTENGTALHYHWSPLLRSEDVPYLAPKTKLYPAEKTEQLKHAEPLMPLTTIVDAVIELAEREPLHIRPSKIDPRWANQPFAQGWELDPQEMDKYAKTRFFPSNAITITYATFWEDETIEKLEALSRDSGKWAAGLILGNGILKHAERDAYARVDAELARAWRAQSEQARWEIFWQGWRAGVIGLTDLKIAGERASFVPQRSPYNDQFKSLDLIQELAHARQFIARLLQPLDPLTWYSFKSFAEYVRGLRPDFIHTATNQETWFLAAKKTRHRFDPNQSQNWDESYRAILAAILDTTLRWIGVTQVAYEGKELAAFRITALGASLLSGGKVNVPAELADPNAPPVAWVNETTIRLRPTPDAAKAMPIVRALADPTRESLTFRATNTTLARALERGITVAEIAEQFAAVNAPLPNALHAQLDALAANYGRAHLYEHLTVIELGDDFALRELLASTSLNQFVVHQFSPRLVVVRDENVDDWVNEIVKKGYTPKVVQ